MDYKKVFGKFEDENVFIKTTTQPSMDSARKVALNRKGNVLFNSGDVEGARRIFMTTGYSDGLSRIGDYYKSKNRFIEALHMYWIAPDRVKAEPLVMQLAGIIQNMAADITAPDIGETDDINTLDTITTVGINTPPVSIIHEEEGPLNE
jgi:hypothetical protein